MLQTEPCAFIAGRSMTEQIFNINIQYEKCLHQQQNLYHVFIHLKKEFDRIWHVASWSTMRKYSINGTLVRTIEHLYDKATSKVQMNGSTGEWFRTTVVSRQYCLFLATLFNIFPRKIMTDALEEHDGTVSIGGRIITICRLPMAMVLFLKKSRN